MNPFRPILCFVIIALFAPLIFVFGCGGGSSGGGGGGKTGGLTASGKVSLPTGFKLPLSQLQVVTDSQQVNVKSDGSFSATVNSAGPRTALLVDKVSGKMCMIGYVDASASSSSFAAGHGSISSTTTADALLFMGLLGPALPTANWNAFLAGIQGSSQETQLAGVVSNSVIANPTALTDGDSNIESSVASVQGTYTAPSFTPSRTAALVNSSPEIGKQTASIARIVVKHDGESGALINVLTSSPQSSVTVEPNPNGDGIVVVSSTRRRGVAFVYKVGVGPDTQHITALTPPEETFADVDVEPTEEIGSVQMSILNGLRGKFAYLPVINPPILVQPDPTAEVAVYDVVIIGCGVTDTIAQVEKSVAGGNSAFQASLDTTWRTALTNVANKLIFKDIVKPILIEWALGAIEGGEESADDATDSELETVCEEAPGFAQAIAAEDYQGAAKAVFTAIEENTNAIKTQVMVILARALVSKGLLSAANFQTVIQLMGKAAVVVQVINKGIAVADVTQAFHDNHTYNTADFWQADVLQPKVTLTPQKSGVDTNDPLVHMAVAIQNVTDYSAFRFQWTCTNTEGKLESATSTAALGTGIIPDEKAVYVTDFTKFQVGGSDTITVQVFDENDLVNPIGTASAQIVGLPAPCTNTPPAPIVFGSLAPTVSLSENATRPGDLLTVTVSWPADPARNIFCELDLANRVGDFGSDPDPNQASSLVSVDGVPAKSSTAQSIQFVSTPTLADFQYPVADTRAAQTHRLVFKMLEPEDAAGNPEPSCSMLSGSSGTPPYVEASGATNLGVGDSNFMFVFLNENP